MASPNPNTRRLVLRAELTHGDVKHVTHTIELSDSLVSVQAEETAYIGDRVNVRFSFPGLIDPFSVETQVVAKQQPTGPGRLGAWTLGFVFYDEKEQKQLQALLSALDAPVAAPSGCRYRVLLVEDNVMTREAFTLAVSKMFGHPDSRVQVDIVGNSDDAWQHLRTKSYDLAIIDQFLPLVNGDRLIAQLRREPSLTALPIVAISIGGPEAKQAALDAGADLFLHKPFVLRDLFVTLQQLAAMRDY